MPLRWEQLPASLRERVRAAAAAEPAARRKPRRTAGVPYRCADCGTQLLWTTTEDATPKAVEDHQADTGHARYEMVMDTTS